MTAKLQLFIDRDPAAVSSWCRSHAAPGSTYIAPSAASRRLALQSVVDRDGFALGLTVSSRSRFLPMLESRAGLATPHRLSGSLERLLVTQAAQTAQLPLFDDGGIVPPRGAVAAVANLIRTLRLNRITPEQFNNAGGDSRASEAFRLFEKRRNELGLLDETDCVGRLLRFGIPSLSLVLEEPTFPNVVTWELYSAAISASSSCHVGVSDFTELGVPPITSLLENCGFVTTSGNSPLTQPLIRATGGAGKQDEIELVAREMLSLLRSGLSIVDESETRRLLRPGDVLGVAPNSNYLTLLHEACSRLGIPVASPRRRAASEVPIVRALLETFRLLADADGDTNERGLALLATPYFGLAQDASDSLSRELVVEGLGAMRTWHRMASQGQSKKFASLAASVTQLSAKLGEELSPGEFSAILASFGLKFGFLSTGRRYHLAAGRDDALRMDQQGWNALTSAMSELSEALRIAGVTRLTARKWLSELTEMVSAATIRVDAKALDGIHLTIAGAGIPRAAHVFAVGWLEGVFPRRFREDPLLPERVKRALNSEGAMFSLATDRTSQDNERRERIHRAARESLTISWPSTGDEGELLLPSFYMSDLGINNPARRSVGETTWPLSLAASRSERFARATLLARHRPANEDGLELDDVRSALRAMTDRERRSYDGMLHAQQKTILPATILAEWTPLAATMSASQSRMVGHCLFEHFGKRRLQLEILGPPQVDMRLIGTIAHGVLSELGRAGFDSTAIVRTLAEWWDREIPNSLRANSRVIFEREMLLANLNLLVERERAHLAASGTIAKYFELSFGLNDDGRDPSSLTEGLVVRLPEGTVIAESIVRGSIDRVDILERDGKLFGMAIDYKSGKGQQYGIDMHEMADFQLPVYCEVLEKLGIEPVGAVYLGIGSGERYGVVNENYASAFLPDSGADEVRLLSPGDFSKYMRDRQAALRRDIARLARGELAVKPRNDDCGYCDLRPVCRVGTFGVGATYDYE